MKVRSEMDPLFDDNAKMRTLSVNGVSGPTNRWFPNHRLEAVGESDPCSLGKRESVQRDIRTTRLSG